MYLSFNTINLIGDYWDSYVDRGVMYLWKSSGEILLVDINRLFEDANCSHVHFSEGEINKYIISRINNPFNELHTDIGIYDSYLYTLTDEGIFRNYLNGDGISAIDNESKIWDAILLSLRIKKNGRVVLSAGEDGLFEYDINKRFAYSNNLIFKKVEKEQDIFRISDKSSLFSNWLHSSIYSTSNKEKAFIVGFDWDGGTVKYKNIFSQNEIFNESRRTSFSWGFGDKIYRATEDGLEYVVFTQARLSTNKSVFSDVKKVDFQRWKGKILFAGAANFGAIIECEHALVIMQDKDLFYNIPGEITRWRVFSDNTKPYDQLHVVLDDRMIIYY